MNVGRKIIAVLLSLLMVFGVCSAANRKTLELSISSDGGSSNGGERPLSASQTLPRRIGGLHPSHIANLRVLERALNLSIEAEQKAAADKLAAEQELAEQKKAAQDRLDRAKAAEAARLVSASIVHDEALKGPILTGEVPKLAHTHTSATGTSIGSVSNNAAQADAFVEPKPFGLTAAEIAALPIAQGERQDCTELIFSNRIQHKSVSY